jgi:hypothetical protein
MVQDPDAIFQKLQDDFHDGQPIEVLRSYPVYSPSACHAHAPTQGALQH